MILTWTSGMTDGPHKSLPMARPWKRVMEWAMKGVYSPREVLEAQRAAIFSDFVGSAMDRVRQIVAGSAEGVLFFDGGGVCEKLERVRAEYRGNVAVEATIDGLQVIARKEVLTQRSYTEALEQAVRDRLERGHRAIDQHHLDKVGHEGLGEVRKRLESTRTPEEVRGIVGDLLSGTNLRKRRAVAPQTGIEHGPALIRSSK